MYRQTVNVDQLLGENHRLRQKNSDLDSENIVLKRRVKGCETLAVMLSQSQEEVTLLKDTVEALTAASRANSLDINSSPLCSRQSLVAPKESNEKSTNHCNGDFTEQCDFMVHRTSSMKSESTLNSEVVPDSSPSDVDAECQSNQEASIQSEHAHNSKQSSLPPLQSINTESLRSEASGENTRFSLISQCSDDRCDSVPSVLVRDLEAAVNRIGGGVGQSVLTPKWTEMIRQTANLERVYNTKTILCENLMQESENVKSENKRIKEEYEGINEHLREEIEALKLKLRQVYDERDKQDYEVVEKAEIVASMKEKKESLGDQLLLMMPSHSDNSSKLKKRISELEKQNKEVIQVNQQWDSHYKAMKASLEAGLRDTKRELEEVKDDNNRLRSSSASFGDRKQKDVDRMLIDAKKRIEVEENNKEHLAGDLRTERERSQTLQQRVTLLERQVMQLMHQRTGLEKEVRRLNKALSELPPQPRGHQLSEMEEANPMNGGELRSHVEALEAQVVTYKEDFQTERRDRERMVSELEDLKKQVETMRQEKDTYLQQARWYEEDFRKEKQDKERIQGLLNNMRTRDANYQLATNRVVEKERYLPPPAVPQREYQQRLYDYPRRDIDYHGYPYRAQQAPQYTAEEIQELQFSRIPQLLPRGQKRPDNYPKHGRNLARNDLVTDDGDDVIDGRQSPIITLNCPRCQREFQQHDGDSFEVHVERCMS